MFKLDNEWIGIPLYSYVFYIIFLSFKYYVFKEINTSCNNNNLEIRKRLVKCEAWCFTYSRGVTVEGIDRKGVRVEIYNLDTKKVGE